jgi:hypothetical protein
MYKQASRAGALSTNGFGSGLGFKVSDEAFILWEKDQYYRGSITDTRMAQLCIKTSNGSRWVYPESLFASRNIHDYHIGLRVFARIGR